MWIRQFSTITTYIRIVGKILDQYLHLMFSSNSGGQGPKKQANYWTNLSPNFNKNQDLVTWIGEQPYRALLVRNFPTTLIYVVMLENCRSNILMNCCYQIRRISVHRKYWNRLLPHLPKLLFIFKSQVSQVNSGQFR